MTAPDFLDTNVLVYAYDDRDVRKQAIARELLRRAVAKGSFISTQVLAEFTATLLHKISPPADPRRLRRALSALAAIRLTVPDASVVSRAIDARTAYGVHFYDGMIISAAEKAACGRILSEDLNPEQQYFGISVVNPFA